MKPRVYFARGWWRIDWPNGDTTAAPTIGALTRYAAHAWVRGFHR